MRRETAKHIDDLAARWAARADRGVSAGERAELEAWLGADPRNLGAFARAQAVLAAADRSRALGSQFARQNSPVRWSRRGWLGAAAAMAAAAAAAGVIGIWQPQDAREVATAKGQIQIEPLPDGSRLTLDTQSRVRVAFDQHRRAVRLLAGTALFDVAKDKQRPFVVEAGDTRVTAVGTSFSVAIDAAGAVRVVVREGVVTVADRGRPAARVKANTEARSASLSNAAPPILTRSLAASEVARSLAWREGMLAFEDQPLSAAAEDFLRYSDVRISIPDPALARKRVAGWFSANDPRGFARAVAITMDARVEDVPGGVRIVR